MQFQRQRGHTIDGSTTSPAVKSEQSSEAQSGQHQPQLYRLSPSPAPQLPYDATLQSNANCSSPGDLHYSPSVPSNSSLSYSSRPPGNGVLSMPNTDIYYHQPYIRSESSSSEPPCTCLTNPAAGHPLISLTQQLQHTIELLRQLPEHAAARHDCVILKRITQLNDLMHGGSGESTPQTPFDALPTPPDGELLSPVSTSSHSSLSNTIQPHDWPALSASSAAQYDTYFQDSAIYQKPYHIN